VATQIEILAHALWVKLVFKAEQRFCSQLNSYAVEEFELNELPPLRSTA
jgi:hypothetical protein